MLTGNIFVLCTENFSQQFFFLALAVLDQENQLDTEKVVNSDHIANLDNNQNA